MAVIKRHESMITAMPHIGLVKAITIIGCAVENKVWNEGIAKLYGPLRVNARIRASKDVEKSIIYDY